MRRKVLIIILLFSIVLVSLGLDRVNSYADTSMDTENVRIWGNNRYDTSIAVAEELFRLNGKFDSVVLAYGGNFPDALSGGYLSIVENGPIILIDKNQEQKVTAFIKRRMKANGTVFLLGGAAVISSSYEQSLKKNGFKVQRLAGLNALETNLSILKHCANKSDSLLIATATNFADSLSGSSVGIPMMLTRNGKLTESQKTWIELSGIKHFYILGGKNAVPESVESELKDYGITERIAGGNRYETSAAIAKRFFDNTKKISLVTGRGYSDGLSGAPLAAYHNSPIFLVDEEVWSLAGNYATEKGIKRSICIGGSSAVPANIVARIIKSDKDITGYNINREDYSLYQNNGDFLMYFDHIELMGKGEIVDKLNPLIINKKSLYKLKAEKKRSGISIYDGYDFSLEQPRTYEPYDLEIVFFSENQLSICWHSDWYDGGVHNDAWDAINVDINTMKDLSIFDLLGSNAKSKVQNAMLEGRYASLASNLNNYDIENATFCFDKSYVYVFFKSYEINNGTGGVRIVVKR